MIDETEEKRQKRNVEFGVLLMICAVIIAYEYNLHGYALALSFISILPQIQYIRLFCNTQWKKTSHKRFFRM